MNPHILMVLDHLANPDKYTQEQLKDNALVACYAAYYSAFDDEVVVTALASHVSVCANAYYYDDDDDGDVEYWLNNYFERSGENKDDYIKELNK